MGRIDREYLRGTNRVTIVREFSENEIRINVRIINETPDDEDYIVQLRTEGGEIVDEEPDFFNFTVTSGAGGVIDLSSVGHRQSYNDFGRIIWITLLKDEVFGNRWLDDVYINLARPQVVSDTLEEAVGTITPADEAEIQEEAECGVFCQFWRKNRTTITVVGVAVVGLLAYSLYKRGVGRTAGRVVRRVRKEKEEFKKARDKR